MTLGRGWVCFGYADVKAKAKMKEVRFFGRGGQGVVIGAEMLTVENVLLWICLTRSLP